MNKQNLLFEIITHACNHSDFYRYALDDINFGPNNITKSLKKMKIIDRDMVLKNEQDIISECYSGVAQKDLFVHLTSGTTGDPLKIYWNKNDSLKSNLVLWRKRKKYYGITPTDRYCCLHTTTYSGERVGHLEKLIYSSDKTSLSLCKLFYDEETLLKYYDAICDFKPKWMFIQASFLIRLINVLEKNNLKLPSTIKYVEFAGETVFDYDYKKVKSHIDCNIANMYGSMETNGIAYECPNGHLHVLSENVYVECLDRCEANASCGMSVITSLTNTAFPLIRYNLGDIIKIDNSVICEFSDEPIIKEVIGRQKRPFLSTGKEVFSETSIDYSIRRTVSEFGNFLYEYRAHFANNDDLIITIYLRPEFTDWRNEISTVIKKNFNTLYPSINADVQYESDYFNSVLPLKRTHV